MDKPGLIELQIGVRDVTDVLRIGWIGIGPGRFITISISTPGGAWTKQCCNASSNHFYDAPRGKRLGLATVREIVQEHNGAVEVQSALGAGTRFDIWLPAVSSMRPYPLHMRRRGRSWRWRTVLVLETERERLLRHEEILAALGYEPSLHRAA